MFQLFCEQNRFDGIYLSPESKLKSPRENTREVHSYRQVKLFTYRDEKRKHDLDCGNTKILSITKGLHNDNEQ